MATMYPNPHPMQASAQGGGDVPPPGMRYQARTYQPYVFQPNFLKQQMRQRELEKAAHLGQLGDGSAQALQLGLGQNLPFATSSRSLPQNILDDASRKKSGRKVIDWTSSCAIYLERRRWQRVVEDIPSLLPDTSYSIEMQATMAYKDNSASSVATKFVRSATNKMKCPVYKVVWTPDGRRLVTGSASGEFTLWNGTAFNFETILQAHDSAVRAMSWSRNDTWLITGDNQGYIKYWQLNMNNVKMYQAHKDQACRSVCFGPTDSKFVTASDDGTVRVWDFVRCREEHILRGHGSDVKQVDWHPQKCIIASASKDLQTPVKLWDPRSGQSLATIHAHKGTVMDVKFNRNGNWFLTASRDHLIKLYDIRNLKEEKQIFRGHKKEAFSVAWHPIHEDMFASGGSEGSIMYWQVGEDKEIGGLEGAHDSLIWSLAWHPLGHILVSGSNDHSTKFWTRNRPGDQMKDRYTLLDDSNATSKTTPSSSSNDKSTEVTSIPGMGDTDAAAAEIAKRDAERTKSGIPGLDWSFEEKNEFDRKIIAAQNDNRKKIPYTRPVPRSFAAAWESNKEGAPRRSRSPSPNRYEEQYGWRRNDRPPPRIHRPHLRGEMRSSEDYIPMERGMEEFVEVRRPLLEHPPDPEGRLPPADYPPPSGPPRRPSLNDQPRNIDYEQDPREQSQDYYPEDKSYHEPRPMPPHPDNGIYNEQNHIVGEYPNQQEYEEFGGPIENNVNFHNEDRGLRPSRGRYGPPRGRGRVFPRESMPERVDWHESGNEDQQFSQDYLPGNQDGYCQTDNNYIGREHGAGGTYNLIEQEELAYNKLEMQLKHGGPLLGRGMNHPRRPFRGHGPPRVRGRGTGRGAPRYLLEHDGAPRGRPPNRMRRGMRRPMFQ
ncbi:pre-mRNA 3' end processing protein WDR33-like [Clavelina lepadiformis]|uniref:IFT140 first beta-propeller domain-containing protein n=1 Tax=Clavelina lepadiformis TaxID=159417 RepID=A0ABP0H750_CLALP